jgi:outer membrane autotransporter protein
MFSACATQCRVTQSIVRAQNTVINVTTGVGYADLKAALDNTSSNGATIYFTTDQTLASTPTYLGRDNTVFTGSDTRISITTAASSRLMVRLEGNKTMTLQNIDIIYGGGPDANSTAGAISLYNEVAGGSAYILGSYSFSGFGATSQTGGQGGALHSTVSNFVLGTEGGRVVFSENRAGQIAGAIRAQNITFNADAVLTGNTAGTVALASNARGGALWAETSITFWGASTISGNSLVNTTLAGSSNAGGAIYLNATDGRLLFDKDAVITGNVNHNGSAGAVYARGGVQAASGLFVASNTAAFTVTTGNVIGGAFYVLGDITVKGAVTASNNYAHTHGGAFYLAGSGTFNGGSTFTNNTAATGAGGAIFWAGANDSTLTIAANTDGIVFQGNTANGAASAIHLGNSSGGVTNTLALSADAGRVLSFFDPISSAGISAGATNIVGISGAGEVLFDTHRSTVFVSTTVHAGATMRLANGAIYGAGPGSGGFTLAGGAKLAGNGAVEADSIVIQPGALVEVTDGGALAINSANPVSITGAFLGGSGTLASTGALEAALVNVGAFATTNAASDVNANTATTAATAAQTLHIAPGATLTIAAGGTIAIDLFGGNASDLLAAGSLAFAGGVANINLSGQTGSYTVLQSTGSTFSAANFNILVNGLAPTARYEVTPVVSSCNGGAGSQLDIAFLQKNIGVTWTGDAGGTWQSSLAANASWTDGASTNADNFFQNGDRVSFDDTAALKTITIAPEGVTVGGMTVANSAGNDYTFTGAGGITAGATATLPGSAFTPSGKLVKTGAGTLTFANTGANIFSEGIELGGGKLAFAGGAQLGDGGRGISVTASSTIAPAADGADGTAGAAGAAGAAFGNNIALDGGPAVTLAFDVSSAGAATYSGKITGVAGTVAKNGAGVLVFTNDSAAFVGTITANAGGLLLDGGRVSNVIVAAQALFGGSGHADNVDTQPGSILQAGTPGVSGTLRIGTLNLAAGSRVNYSILADDQSSALHVTNPVAGAGVAAGASTLNFNAWLSGTYNLGNATALANAAVTLNNMSLNVRQTYLLASASGTLQFIINPVTNGILVWDGTCVAPGLNGAWDTTSENWFGAGAVSTRYAFTAYDSIVFDDRVNSPARRAIDMASACIASAMAVGGSGTYTFTGAGGVTTDTTGVFGITADGKLTKTGPGTLTFANTGGNHFQNGIDIGATGATDTTGATGATGGVIEFTQAGQLAVATGAAITFLNTGTLRALAAPALAGELSTPIHIASGVAATLDAGANGLVYSGTITPLGATATLNKTGAGDLRLTGAGTNTPGLATNILQGRLMLDAGAPGGTITLFANTTLGGSGAATGVTNALAGSTIRPGFDTNPGGPALLHFASLQLADGSTLAAASGNATLTGAATLNGRVYAAIDTGLSLTLSGSIGGAGGMIKTGAGNLIYASAGALSYTGITQIDSGYVMIRGITGTNAPAVRNTILLNGGWLDLSDSSHDATGATASDWAGLVIIRGTNASGGVIGGNDAITLRAGDTASNIGGDAGAGVFVVIDAGNGSAVLTGVNPYKGYTRIDSGTLHAGADAQLGDTSASREVILNGGALRLTGGFATTRNLELRADGAVSVDAGVEGTWAGITRPGGNLSLTKNGPGALVIAGASQASGLIVAEGRYVARTGAGAGEGQVTVADGAAFEYRGISGAATVSNKFTGPGAFFIVSSTLSLGNGGNDVARISVGAGSLVTLSGGVFGDAASTLAIDASRVNVSTNAVTLGAVTLSNQATLAFNAPSAANINTGPFRYATLAALAGGGTLCMNTNLAQGIGDKLFINGPAAGDYTLIITNTGATPAAYSIPLTLITAPADSAATFTVPGGKVDAGGMFAYDFVTTQRDGQTLFQLAGAGALGNTGRLINELAGALPLAWYSELENVNRRMGELRAGAAAAPRAGVFTTWIRGLGQKLVFNGKATGSPFTEKQYGVSAGADYKFPRMANALCIGGYAGYGRMERGYDGAGHSSSDSSYGGLYATFWMPAGWYIDGTLKVNGFNNRFDASAITGESISGNYKTCAFGGSIETGKNMDLGKGWFFEPQVQVAFTALVGKNYTTSSGMDVELRFGATTQLRGSIRIGRALVTKKGRYLQLHAKAGLASQWTTDGQMTAGGSRFAPTIKGDSASAGAGLAWVPVKSTQLFFDCELGNASYYNKPWSLNGGIRHAF